MGLQFLNIKAWMLALTLTAGWVVNAAGAPAANPGERLAIISAIMVVFAFSSNFAYALLGSMLRQWLSQGRACSGSTALWRSCWRPLRPGCSLYEARRKAKAFGWAWLGVAIFALTLPMTRLAVGTPEAPQMSGVFIALGRAAVAALLSTVFLLATRAPLPRRDDWLPLAITSGGVVFGFPLLSSIAMRHVEAVHASVILGVLPLATAAVGAWLHRQRPSAGFWACAALGQRAGRGLRGAALRPEAAWRSSPPMRCCWRRRLAPPWATAGARGSRSACAPST